jgi:hypothetical protein
MRDTDARQAEGLPLVVILSILQQDRGAEADPLWRAIGQAQRDGYAEDEHQQDPEAGAPAGRRVVAGTGRGAARRPPRPPA